MWSAGSMAEHLSSEQKVTGSSPVSVYKIFFAFAFSSFQMEWLVLQDTVWPHNRAMLGVTLVSIHVQATQASGVAGSNVRWPTITNVWHTNDRDYTYCAPLLPWRDWLLHISRCDRLAQWQSICLRNRRLRVRVPCRSTKFLLLLRCVSANWMVGFAGYGLAVW